MGLIQDIKSLLVQTFVFHLVAGFTFVVSGLIICFFMLIAYLTIWPWDQLLYRKVVVHLAYMHWCQFTFLGQWWSGSDCTIFLENLEDLHYLGKEHTIVIMNHKYDIDWMMGWMLSERVGLLGGTKIYGKSSLRFVPLIGWAWTFTESIFLKREWESDRKTLVRDLKYVTDYPPNYWVTLLLFPEGTRFTESKHKASMEIARKKGYPELKHHLLPRTKGFILSVRGVKGKVPTILDITIGFRDDGARPTLLNIVQGRKCLAEMYIRRIPVESIPTETDEECSAWLHKLYREKDEIYDNFVQNGHYTIGHKHQIPRRPHDLLFWSLWMLTVGYPFVQFLWTLIITGSFMLQLGFLAFFILVGIGFRYLISISEIEKGSSYGKKTA